MTKIELVRSVNLACKASDGGTEIKARFYRPGIYQVTKIHAEARIDRSVMFEPDAAHLLEIGYAVPAKAQKPTRAPRNKSKRGPSLNK